MQSDDPDEIDFSELFSEEAYYQTSFISFYNYLDTMVFFLENESKEHNERIRQIEEKIRSGEIPSPHDPHQMPPEIHDEYSRLGDIAEFEGILFDSFFVAIYFYLESELKQHCRDLEKQHPSGLSFTDIAGKDLLERVKTYLIKVHHIEFSFSNSPEWEKIQKYRILRNCIVHNQGKLDEGLEESQRRKLLKFIQESNPKLQLSNTWCILNKDFCLEAIDTIRKFLSEVVFAKTKAQ